METEIYGTYKCARGEFECVYMVEYTTKEVSSIFTAHDKTGSLTNNYQTTTQIDIEYVDCYVMYDTGEFKLDEFKPNQEQLDHIESEIRKYL